MAGGTLLGRRYSAILRPRGPLYIRRLHTQIASLQKVHYGVDSGRGQNHTLGPLWTLWPPVFAGEQDAGPPKGWDVGQELGLDYQPGVFPLSERFAEMGGIPAPIGFGNET